MFKFWLQFLLSKLGHSASIWKNLVELGKVWYFPCSRGLDNLCLVYFEPKMWHQLWAGCRGGKPAQSRQFPPLFPAWWVWKYLTWEGSCLPWAVSGRLSDYAMKHWFGRKGILLFGCAFRLFSCIIPRSPGGSFFKIFITVMNDMACNYLLNISKFANYQNPTYMLFGERRISVR